ncbi:MAG: hypothetical protein RL885_08090 [Planctomycetota bacterium]
MARVEKSTLRLGLLGAVILTSVGIAAFVYWQTRLDPVARSVSREVVQPATDAGLGGDPLPKLSEDVESSEPDSSAKPTLPPVRSPEEVIDALASHDLESLDRICALSADQLEGLEIVNPRGVDLDRSQEAELDSLVKVGRELIAEAQRERWDTFHGLVQEALRTGRTELLDAPPRSMIRPEPNRKDQMTAYSLHRHEWHLIRVDYGDDPKLDRQIDEERFLLQHLIADIGQYFDAAAAR